MAVAKKPKGGRKGKYETHVKPRFDEIEKWLNHGATEKQVAQRLGVAYSSFNDYKNKHSEFLEVLKKRRDGLIDDVRGALVRRALGFEYEEVTTSIKQAGGQEIKIIERKKRYQPPDVGACHLLLKNLDETWRNDDFETMKRKAKEIELKEKQIDADDW